MIRVTPALLLALLLPLACATPRTAVEMRAMLAASTDLGDVTHTALRLIHEEGDAGRAEVQRHFDELPFVGIDPRAGLVFVYDVETDKLLRLQTTRTGLQHVSTAHLYQGERSSDAVRIVTELVPSGSLIYACDADGQHSSFSVLFELFADGGLGANILYNSDESGLAKVRRRPARTAEQANADVFAPPPALGPPPTP